MAEHTRPHENVSQTWRSAFIPQAAAPIFTLIFGTLKEFDKGFDAIEKFPPTLDLSLYLLSLKVSIECRNNIATNMITLKSDQGTSPCTLNWL